MNARSESCRIRFSEHFGELSGKTIAIWGLAFKPKTDDIREAPALVLIDQLLEWGARIRAHDPEAMANVETHYSSRPELTFHDDPMDALDDADGLAILTEWSEFRTPDVREMAQRMKQRVVFDGRNLYDLDSMQDAGFVYYSIGRPAVLGP